MEKKRLDALQAYEIMDTPAEEEFDSIVALAATICKVPIAAIGFIDIDRQWFKARYGFDVPQTERNHSFCTHTILGEKIFIVNDAQGHELFRNYPFVAGRAGVRFYAGIPLRSYHGHALGTLCVMDIQPSDLDAGQQKIFKILGEQVARLLEDRRAGARLGKTMDIQRHLLEWGKLHAAGMDSRRPLTASMEGQCLSMGSMDGRPMGSVELAGQLLETMRSFPCAGRFSIVDMHREFPPCLLPEDELHFIMKCMLLWFCEVAEEGTIMIDELVIKDHTLMVRLQLHSRRFLPELETRADDVYIILANDILRRFNGDLRMKVSLDRVAVSFQMELNAP